MPMSAPPSVRSNRRTRRDVGLKLRARSGPSRTGVLVDMPWQPGRAVEQTRAAVHKKRSARLELRVAQLASADGPRLLGVCERTAHPAAYAVAWRPGAAEGLGTLRISPENDAKGSLSLTGPHPILDDHGDLLRAPESAAAAGSGTTKLLRVAGPTRAGGRTAKFGR